MKFINEDNLKNVDMVEKKIREILFWMKLIKCESNKEIKKTEEVQQMRKKSGMRKTDKSVKDK